MDSHLHQTEAFPGGLLLVARDGTIVDAPRFFREALELRTEREYSVFEVFDAERLPHLSFSRVYNRGGGVVEYHVTVHRGLSASLGFRYWNVTPDSASSDGVLAYYVVDDSSVIQSNEWHVRKLRRYILSDVQNFIDEQVKNRLSTLHALAEVLRDTPDAASESAERILRILADMEAVIDQVDHELEAPGGSLDDDLPMRVHDLPAVFAAWADGTILVDTTLDEDLDEEILVESTVLDEILFPVVINAVESNPRDDRVSIHVALLHDPRRVCFEISDTGSGMSPATLARAEDPFFTTKSGHTGLGLSRARKFLQDRGGYWNFKSSPQRGTTVRICIPAMALSDFFA